MKKVVCVLLSILMCAFVGCDSKQPQEIELIGLEVSAEVEAVFGKDYTVVVPSVKDSSGKSYDVLVKVLKKDNTEVSLQNNTFKVDCIDGYTINYSVKITESNVKTATTKVKVVDKTKPTITINGVDAVYTVGDKISISATVTDDIDADLTATLKVFLLADEEVDYTLDMIGKEYTFVRCGSYEIRAEVSDKSGNNVKTTKIFEVEKKVIKGKYVDFDTKKLFDQNMSGKNGDFVVETGFVNTEIGNKTSLGDGFGYITASKKGETTSLLGYPNFYVAPLITKAELASLIAEGYDRINLNVYLDYIDSSETAKRMIIANWGGKDYSFILDNYDYDLENLSNNNNDDKRGVVKNVWSTVYVPSQVLLDNFDTIGFNEGSAFFYMPNDAGWNGAKNFKLYIDNIYLSKNVSDVIINPEFALGEYNTTLNNTLDITKFTVSSVSEPALKFDRYVKLPNGSIQSIASDATNFIFDKKGEYEFFIKSQNDYCHAKASKKIVVGEVDKNIYVVDLSTEAKSLSNLIGKAGTAQIETGFVKTAIGGRTSNFEGFTYITAKEKETSNLKSYVNYYFNIGLTKEKLTSLIAEGYDRLSMSVYLEGTGTAWHILVSSWVKDYTYIYSSETLYEVNDNNKKLKEGEWNDIYIPAQYLLDSYDAIGFGEGKAFFYSPNDKGWNGQSDYKIYLDTITLTKSK